MGLVLKQNFSFDVNQMFDTTWMVTLYFSQSWARGCHLGSKRHWYWSLSDFNTSQCHPGWLDYTLKPRWPYLPPSPSPPSTPAPPPPSYPHARARCSSYVWRRRWQSGLPRLLCRCWWRRRTRLRLIFLKSSKPYLLAGWWWVTSRPEIECRKSSLQD